MYTRRSQEYDANDKGGKNDFIDRCSMSWIQTEGHSDPDAQHRFHQPLHQWEATSKPGVLIANSACSKQSPRGRRGSCSLCGLVRVSVQVSLRSAVGSELVSSSWGSALAERCCCWNTAESSRY